LLVAQRCELIDLHVRKASLEDVFIGLTREDAAVGSKGERPIA
jgi:hypothetical protein